MFFTIHVALFSKAYISADIDFSLSMLSIV